MSWFNNNESKKEKPNPFEEKPKEPRRKALAPCPKCGSWDTNVENGIFHCENCGYENG